MKKKTQKEIFEELIRQHANKYCFDCGKKSPTFINTTCNTFVCQECSGILREFNFRIKSIYNSIFTEQELENIKGGNQKAVEIYGPMKEEKQSHLVRIHMKLRYQNVESQNSQGSLYSSGQAKPQNEPTLFSQFPIKSERIENNDLRNPVQMLRFGSYQNLHAHDAPDSADLLNLKKEPQYNFSMPVAKSTTVEPVPFIPPPRSNSIGNPIKAVESPLDFDFPKPKVAEQVKAQPEKKKEDPYAAFRELTNNSSIFGQSSNSVNESKPEFDQDLFASMQANLNPQHTKQSSDLFQFDEVPATQSQPVQSFANSKNTLTTKSNSIDLLGDDFDFGQSTQKVAATPSTQNFASFADFSSVSVKSSQNIFGNVSSTPISPSKPSLGISNSNIPVEFGSFGNSSATDLKPANVEKKSMDFADFQSTNPSNVQTIETTSSPGFNQFASFEKDTFGSLSNTTKIEPISSGFPDFQSSEPIKSATLQNNSFAGFMDNHAKSDFNTFSNGFQSESVSSAFASMNVSEDPKTAAPEDFMKPIKTDYGISPEEFLKPTSAKEFQPPEDFMKPIDSFSFNDSFKPAVADDFMKPQFDSYSFTENTEYKPKPVAAFDLPFEDTSAVWGSQ